MKNSVIESAKKYSNKTSCENCPMYRNGCDLRMIKFCTDKERKAFIAGAKFTSKNEKSASKINSKNQKILSDFMNGKTRYDLKLSCLYEENEMEINNNLLIPQVIFKQGNRIEIEFDLWTDEYGYGHITTKKIDMNNLSEEELGQVIYLISNGIQAM